MSKKCRTCQISKSATEFNHDNSHKDGLASECKKCKNARRAKWFEKHRHDPKNKMYRRNYSREWNKKNREKRRLQAREGYYRRRANGFVHRYDPYKDRARRVLERTLKNGKMKRPDKCSDCGWIGKIQAHHHDYSKPLEVEWLCQLCHRRRHRSKDIPIPPVPKRKCEHCSKKFEPRKAGQRFCNERCQMDARNSKRNKGIGSGNWERKAK
jgi:Bacillus phage endonuclease